MWWYQSLHFADYTWVAIFRNWGDTVSGGEKICKLQAVSFQNFLSTDGPEFVQF